MTFGINGLGLIVASSIKRMVIFKNIYLKKDNKCSLKPFSCVQFLSCHLHTQSQYPTNTESCYNPIEVSCCIISISVADLGSLLWHDILYEVLCSKIRPLIVLSINLLCVRARVPAWMIAFSICMLTLKCFRLERKLSYTTK